MWALGALFVAGCAETEKATTDSGLVKSNFQTEVGGKKTDLYVLRNQNNMEVCVTNFGGRIVSVMVPDKEGVMRDVVLGFDSIQDYISKPSDFGASIGRYANRINQGKFTLYQPFQNGIISEEVEAIHGPPAVVNGMLMGKFRYKLGQKTIDLTDLRVRQTVFQLVVVIHRNNPDYRPAANQI